MPVIRRTAFVLLFLVFAAAPLRARNDCSFTIATWNLLNLGERKLLTDEGAPINELLERYAQIFSQYDIIFLQELLGHGVALTEIKNSEATRAIMANYDCAMGSQPSGRAAPSGRQGRQESYGICYCPGSFDMSDPVVPFDAMTVNYPFEAVDGTPQTAQDVWMRPPFGTQLTFIPADDCEDPQPITFSIRTSHTKPFYSVGAPPAGTPETARRNESVHYELEALGMNTDLLFGNAGDNLAIVGDLNADCASYPADFRRTDLTGWTWLIDYGEKTNTAPESHCAYDRILLSPALAARRLDDGVIFSNGINTRIGGKRVSDHYLVYVTIGSTKKKKRELSVSTGAAKKKTRVSEPDETVYIGGSGLSTTSGTSAWLYAMLWNVGNYFRGNQTYALSDVRGEPSDVAITEDGTFAEDVKWSNPPAGAYTLILDVNRDGKFNKNDGDVATYADELDFLVTDTAAMHSDVVTLGDDAQLRETYDSVETVNVYALAKSLPASAEVDLWVVSNKLLPSWFTTWSAALTRGTLDLASVAIPINIRNGPIEVSKLTHDDKVKPVTTGPDGTLLVSAWSSPGTLLNTQVLTSNEPPAVYSPQYANLAMSDACANAYLSTDENFRRVCNVGNLFTDYYGDSFNIVIDVDRDGRLNHSDRVDEHDIGDMTKFFASQPILNATTGNGDPAVGEYKEILNAKVNLSSPLAATDTYDKATMTASEKYLCTSSLPRTAFVSVVSKAAQVGFQVLNALDYKKAAALYAQSSQYEALQIAQSIVADTGVCLAAEELAIAGLTVNANSAASARTDTLRMDSTVDAYMDSSLCLSAISSVEIGAGTEFNIWQRPNAPTATTSIRIGIDPDGTGLPCPILY